MGNLDLEIPEGVYGYLVKWGLSNGYAVTTNEDHSILYGLEGLDRIENLKAWKEGRSCVATEKEAGSVIANLSHLKANEAIPYAPVYCPQIRVDEEMYEHHLTRALVPVNWTIEAHHEGMFWFIQRMWEGGASNIVCRSEVAAFIRSLEYKRRIAPYLVIREKGTQSIEWKGKQIDTLEAALEVVKREKPRHFQGDWQVWEDVTAEALTAPVPDNLESEAGFMVRGRFPVEFGEDCWERSDCEGIKEAILEVVRMEEFEPDVVCAIYACRYHEPAPAEAVKPTKPEDCPICYRVWRLGSVIANGYSPSDDAEAVAESVKDMMASGLGTERGLLVKLNPLPYHRAYKILVYKLATVLEVEA